MGGGKEVIGSQHMADLVPNLVIQHQAAKYRLFCFYRVWRCLDRRDRLIKGHLFGVTMLGVGIKHGGGANLSERKTVKNDLTCWKRK